MALRGRGLANPAKDAVMRSKKRSLGCRAEARELILPEQGTGAAPAIAELARALGVKDPEESMLRLSEVLERSTELFRNSPDFAIPEVRFSQIDDGRFPYYVTRQVNRRGVVVVRGVVPADTAQRWRDELLEYLETNGMSEGQPGARDVFWSKAQVQAREHLGVRQALAALNRLWKPDASTPVDLTKSLSFCDRAFVGSPTCSSQRGRETAIMAGGPGASQRWLSPHHSKAYRDIFEGRWEDWDPFKAGPRMRAAEAASSWIGDVNAASPGLGADGRTPQPFRPFQGYLSFGRWGEMGNVHVVPMMRVATAFTLLRPFMPDLLGAETRDTDWLCGAGSGPELALSPKWHQPILDALVRLPPLSPGDAVFWHTDTIHCEAGAIPGDANTIANTPGSRGGHTFGGGREGGDSEELIRIDGATFAGVQLSSLPICEANSAYLRAQGEAFASGSPPPTFSEGGEGRFEGRALREELTRGGGRAMGLRRFTREHHNPALEEHHRLLDISYEW